MGILNLYDWGLPNQAEHLARYRGNDALYNMARSLWSNIDSTSVYFLIVAVVTSIIIACYYYYGYNKLPGRKYRISHWAIWLSITFAVTVVLTLVIGYIMISSTLKEQFDFMLKISMINGGIAAIIYVIISCIICNIPVPTNAYRFLKIGK